MGLLGASMTADAWSTPVLTGVSSEKIAILMTTTLTFHEDAVSVSLTDVIQSCLMLIRDIEMDGKTPLFSFPS